MKFTTKHKLLVEFDTEAEGAQDYLLELLGRAPIWVELQIVKASHGRDLIEITADFEGLLNDARSLLTRWVPALQEVDGMGCVIDWRGCVYHPDHEDSVGHISNLGPVREALAARRTA